MKTLFIVMGMMGLVFQYGGVGIAQVPPPPPAQGIPGVAAPLPRAPETPPRPPDQRLGRPFRPGRKIPEGSSDSPFHLRLRLQRKGNPRQQEPLRRPDVWSDS